MPIQVISPCFLTFRVVHRLPSAHVSPSSIEYSHSIFPCPPSMVPHISSINHCLCLPCETVQNTESCFFAGTLEGIPLKISIHIWSGELLMRVIDICVFCLVSVFIQTSGSYALPSSFIEYSTIYFCTNANTHLRGSTFSKSSWSNI